MWNRSEVHQQFANPCYHCGNHRPCIKASASGITGEAHGSLTVVAPMPFTNSLDTGLPYSRIVICLE